MFTAGKGLAIASCGLACDDGVLSAPIIIARNINEAIIINIIQTAKNNTEYKVYIKEGAGAYSRWPDASTTFLNNTVSINTGINDSTQYTVKISANNSTDELNSNEVTLTTDFSYYTNINKAFIEWIRYVTGYAASKVIFDKQNMPKPARPYITVDLTSFVQPNMAYNSQVDDSGTRRILSDKEFTLHIHHFGDIEFDSINILINLHESINNIVAYKILQDAKIAFVTNLLGPTDTSPLRDKNTYEKRASMDLLFRIPWRTLDTGAGIISSAEITGTAKIEDQTVYEETVVVNP